MSAIAALLTLASGGLIGIVLGLVGGGGSILAVPLLVYVLGVDSPHAAIGTAAVTVTLNAAASLVGHARAGTVKWPCAIVFARVGFAAGFFGIGGGFLIVLALMAATAMPFTYAVGSSLVVVAALGFTTASSYALSGYVDWSLTHLLIMGRTFRSSMCRRNPGSSDVLSACSSRSAERHRQSSR